jgi:putative membrane-bound dehydrogenase-like protein
VFCYQGGIFVAATPDILYLKDTNGDGLSDFRETVFTGFANGVDRINVQELLNSFIWGLDNRIHGATSGEGGLIHSLRHPEAKAIDLHGRDFAIEPRNLTMSPEAGGGQHGLSFDNFGRRFTCNNSDNIRLFMYESAYGARNPYYSMPAPLVSIAVDGPAAEIYRISPDEPWRVLRTRWRVGGLVPGPIEGGGRASGYFTGATGVTIYRGNAYPEEFRGNAFIADCAGNLIHRKVLIPEGVELKAERPADEQKTEFAASRDTWFRPVQFANAPDGTLYVIDMYREIIEHPWSLPENIKQHLDLNSGDNRGRIYRIAPDGFKQPHPPNLGKASTAELVAAFENQNGWYRDTAARLIYERQDPAAIPLLGSLLKNSRFALTRLHALYALDGLGSLREDQVLQAMEDPEEKIREHAIKLCERFIQHGPSSRQILAKLENLAGDPSSVVRYQLAFTIGQVEAPAKVPVLAALARRDVESAWTRAAILSSLRTGSGELFAQLSRSEAFRVKKEGADFLNELVLMIGSRNDHSEVAQVLEFIKNAAEPAFRFDLVRALGEGLKRAGSPMDPLDTQWKQVFASAAGAAKNTSSAQDARLAAIRLLALTRFDDSGVLLLSFLDQTQSQQIQLAAVSSLNHFNDPRLGPALTKTWAKLSPRLRSEIVSVLLARPDRAIALLEAIRAGAIQAATLTTTQKKFLRTHRETSVRELAAEIFDASPPRQRRSVIEAFTPSLALQGQADAGRRIYQERCISCHRLGGEGFVVGPDLATVKNTGKENLLVNILDPNREVPPQFVAYVIETREGDSYVGLIAAESDNSVSIRQAYGKEDTIPRSRIVSMRSQAQSLMPEGLETGLSQQDFANLLEYVETAQSSGKPPEKQP